MHKSVIKMIKRNDQLDVADGKIILLLLLIG